MSLPRGQARSLQGCFQVSQMIFDVEGLKLATALQENLHKTVGWELSAEEYQKATSIDFQLRMVDGCQFVHPPEEDPENHPNGGLYKCAPALHSCNVLP